MTLVYCNICKNNSLSKVLLSYDTLDRWQSAAGILPKASNRQWVLCDHCGSIQNIMSDDDDLIALTKQNSQYYKVDFDIQDLHRKYRLISELPNSRSDNYHRCQRIYGAIQQVLLSRLPGTFSVLDIGAGLGIFLDQLSDILTNHGIDVYCHAVEPDPLAFSFISSQQRHTCHQVTFDSFIEPSLFNLITLNKVLEHTPDPAELLIQAKKLLLDSRSIIYVEVPSPLTINYRNKENGILGSLHNNLYSIPGLEILGLRSDLVLLSSGTINEPSGKISTYGFYVLDSYFNN